jgi:hypothetical protein
MAHRHQNGLLYDTKGMGRGNHLSLIFMGEDIVASSPKPDLDTAP